jgi:hypothetical protein
VEKGKRSKWSVRSIGTSLPLPCGQKREVLRVEAYLPSNQML